MKPDRRSTTDSAGSDWTAVLEQLAGSLQAVTDKRVIEDMDEDERQAYESIMRAYADRRRAGR